MARDSNVIDWQEPRKKRFGWSETFFVSSVFTVIIVVAIGAAASLMS